MQPILIATRCDACITLVGWCAQPLAHAWRAWVNATATRCKKPRPRRVVARPPRCFYTNPISSPKRQAITLMLQTKPRHKKRCGRGVEAHPRDSKRQGEYLCRIPSCTFIAPLERNYVQGPC